MTFVTVDQHTEEKSYFRKSMKALESQVINAGAHAAVDSKIRLAYSREIKAMAQKLESSAQTGKISWVEAAKQAQESKRLPSVVSSAW